MSKQIDFHTITPCGECCDGCPKKADGLCSGCIETDGCCEEWSASGVCPVYTCTKAHGVRFCGVCSAFPCEHLPMLRWRPDCVKELAELAETYRARQSLPRLYQLTLIHDSGTHREDFHIGLFASQEEAASVSTRYRQEKPGFNQPEITSSITEVHLLDASEIPHCVYRWQGWNVDDDLDECDILESACYADEATAQRSLALAQRDTPRQEWILNRHVIGQCDWTEGFDTSN